MDQVPWRRRLNLSRFSLQRSKLTGTKTPINPTTFAEWKARKKREKEDEEKQKKAKRFADIKAGKVTKTGRELVDFNPELFVDDEDAAEKIEREETEEPLEDDVADQVTGGLAALSLASSSSADGAEGSSSAAVPIDESLFQADDIPEDDDEGEDEDDGEGGDDDDDDDDE